MDPKRSSSSIAFTRALFHSMRALPSFMTDSPSVGAGDGGAAGGGAAAAGPAGAATPVDLPTSASSSSSVVAALAKSLFLISPLTETNKACTFALSGPARATLMAADRLLSRFITSALPRGGPGGAGGTVACGGASGAVPGGGANGTSVPGGAGETPSRGCSPSAAPSASALASSSGEGIWKSYCLPAVVLAVFVIRVTMWFESFLPLL